MRFYKTGRLAPFCADCDEQYYGQKIHNDIFVIVENIEKIFGITIEIWSTSFGKNYFLMSQELLEWDIIQKIATYLNIEYPGIMDPNYYSCLMGKEMKSISSSRDKRSAVGNEHLGNRVSQKLTIDYSGRPVKNPLFDIRRLTKKRKKDSLIIQYREVLMKYYCIVFS